MKKHFRIAFALILRHLHDHRGEVRLPTGKRLHIVDGVHYLVSARYCDSSEHDPSSSDLREIFARLVKNHAALLTGVDSHDTMVSEPVPAADIAANAAMNRKEDK